MYHLDDRHNDDFFDHKTIILNDSVNKYDITCIVSKHNSRICNKYAQCEITLYCVVWFTLQIFMILHWALEASEPKWVNPKLNIIGVNSLRLGGFQLEVNYMILFLHYWYESFPRSYANLTLFKRLSFLEIPESLVLR